MANIARVEERKNAVTGRDGKLYSKFVVVIENRCELEVTTERAAWDIAASINHATERVIDYYAA